MGVSNLLIIFLIFVCFQLVVFHHLRKVAITSFYQSLSESTFYQSLRHISLSSTIRVRPLGLYLPPGNHLPISSVIFQYFFSLQVCNLIFLCNLLSFILYVCSLQFILYCVNLPLILKIPNCSLT